MRKFWIFSIDLSIKETYLENFGFQYHLVGGKHFRSATVLYVYSKSYVFLVCTSASIKSRKLIFAHESQLRRSVSLTRTFWLCLDGGKSGSEDAATVRTRLKRAKLLSGTGILHDTTESVGGMRSCS